MLASFFFKRIALKKRHFSYLKCLFFGFFLYTWFIPFVAAENTCLSPEEQLAQVDEWGSVSKIIDGDTVHLLDGRKIRLIGINTPEIGRRGESSQPYGKKAYDALVKILKNHKKIGLTYDKDRKDRYKRVLAYVNLSDGQSIEQIILSQGLAHSIVVPPNDSRIQCFRNIEKTARQAGHGLWGLPENQWIQADKLSSRARGLRYLSGRVIAYSESKKSIYLKLNAKLSIRIAKKDAQYFRNVNLKKLDGQSLMVRGWVSTYKGRQTIHVRSQYDLHQ